jgi:hypothetical protein
VTPQAGSPQVTSVEHASIGSDPQVTADVRGDMHQPRLSWKTKGSAGQVVTFVEEADDVAHVITRTDDAKGTLEFTPADGPAGTRTIVAIVEQGGIPRARMTVAQYQAPDPDDDAPNDSLARKRLGELKRSVVRADLRPSLERELVGSLRAARRALRPPTPNVATACARIDDFIVQVKQAARRPATPPTQASQWLEAAASIKQLLRCT